jgi:hypothetical protein
MALHPIVFTGLARGLDIFRHYEMNDAFAVAKRIRGAIDQRIHRPHRQPDAASSRGVGEPP